MDEKFAPINHVEFQRFDKVMIKAMEGCCASLQVLL